MTLAQKRRQREERTSSAPVGSLSDVLGLPSIYGQSLGPLLRPQAAPNSEDW
jgi:hypothetical protein